MCVNKTAFCALAILFLLPSFVWGAEKVGNSHQAVNEPRSGWSNSPCTIEYQRHRITAQPHTTVGGRKARIAMVCNSNEAVTATSELQPGGLLIVLVSASKKSHISPLDIGFLNEALPLLTEGLPGITSINTLSEGQQFVTFSSAMILTDMSYSIRGESHEVRFVFTSIVK